MVLLHPASIAQFALPRILKEVGDDHIERFKGKLKASSHQAYKRISQIPGLVPVKAVAA
jgi:aspartate/methionine/tyrosine aminotransferase